MEEQTELVLNDKPRLYHKKMWKIVDESMEKVDIKVEELTKDINGNEVDESEESKEGNTQSEQSEGKTMPFFYRLTLTATGDK